MDNRNKTISFHVNEDAFETLREIAEERDISLSAIFRGYVDTLVTHDGQVQVVPKHEFEKLHESEDGSFPPTVKISKNFIRRYGRLELRAEYLREQPGGHKGYASYLHEQIENDHDDVEEVIQLENLDTSDEPSFHLG